MGNQIQNEFSKFQELCNAEREYNIDAINAIGDLMVSLADLFDSLGGNSEDLDFRKGKEFVDKLVIELNKIKDIGLGDLQCDKPESSKLLLKLWMNLLFLLRKLVLIKSKNNLVLTSPSSSVNDFLLLLSYYYIILLCNESVLF